MPRCNRCKKWIWFWQREYLIQVDDFASWHKKCYDRYYWEFFYDKYEMKEKGVWRLKNNP
jgi:hypothetical protein